jgi:hypothetical protein
MTGEGEHALAPAVPESHQAQDGRVGGVSLQGGGLDGELVRLERLDVAARVVHDDEPAPGVVEGATHQPTRLAVPRDDEERLVEVAHLPAELLDHHGLAKALVLQQGGQ